MELHYVEIDHDSHPFEACIVSDTYIGSVVQFRDENQMRCYAMGFLHAFERDQRHIEIAQIELRHVEALPTSWDRQKLAFGHVSNVMFSSRRGA